MDAKIEQLILVTGPTGSGKSTTLAAMIEHVNQNSDRHIITIEDPIEYKYQCKKSLIHQREVGEDVGSFADALRSALREDPDVILVGEMRDYETISAALLAAETGHLYFYCPLSKVIIGFRHTVSDFTPLLTFYGIHLPQMCAHQLMNTKSHLGTGHVTVELTWCISRRRTLNDQCLGTRSSYLCSNTFRCCCSACIC